MALPDPPTPPSLAWGDQPGPRQPRTALIVQDVAQDEDPDSMDVTTPSSVRYRITFDSAVTTSDAATAARYHDGTVVTPLYKGDFSATRDYLKGPGEQKRFQRTATAIKALVSNQGVFAPRPPPDVKVTQNNAKAWEHFKELDADSSGERHVYVRFARCRAECSAPQRGIVSP